MKQVPIAFCLALLLPICAPAQTVNANPEILHGCVASAFTASDAELCLGKMTEDCRAGTAHGAPLFIEDLCAVEEKLQWGNLIRDIFEQLQIDARKSDDAATGWLKNLDGQLATLTRSQAAWEAHRDAECAYLSARMGAQDRRNVAESLCARDLNASRFATLKSIHEALK